MLIAFFLLNACTEERSSEGVADSRAFVSPANEWMGLWQGPEGTSLQIDEMGGRYRITIRNLDGPREFEGDATKRGLEFVRDGVRESIHTGSGADTGMKWLADKSNCLIVKPGEGYCRG